MTASASQVLGLELGSSISLGGNFLYPVSHLEGPCFRLFYFETGSRVAQAGLEHTV